MNFLRKNVFYLGVISAAIGFLSTACGEKSGEGNHDSGDPIIEFQSYEYDVIAQLDDSIAVKTMEGGEFCRVTGQGILPHKIGDKDITSLRDSLMKLSGVIIIEDKTLHPNLESDFKITEINPKDTVACGSMINNLSVDMVTPQLIVWKEYSYQYLCGAAHGLYNTTYVNYSLEKGIILDLKDIFEPEYENNLTELIRRKLKENGKDLLVSIDEINIPQDFRITTDGMEFVFGLYEIASYAEGEIGVKLDKYELEDMMRQGMAALIYGDSD